MKWMKENRLIDLYDIFTSSNYTFKMNKKIHCYLIIKVNGKNSDNKG